MSIDSWDETLAAVRSASSGVKASSQTPSTDGVKHDNGKPDMSLLSSAAIEEIAKVMTFGKQKYGAHNWRKGIVYSRLLAAVLRHLFAFLRREDKDPETGLSHLAHAGCGIMMLLDFERNKPQLDDRPEV